MIADLVLLGGVFFVLGLLVVVLPFLAWMGFRGHRRAAPRVRVKDVEESR